ncbi:TIGR03808 family TAT-translocated repetitive protein [Aestuariivirga sp.]|uniref:TIGR03808 family TAT-translocated repetitive protein n=1 Tax=Aestuariivirga sp. TaxID=2650926 RepID=UPI00359349DA
MTLNRRMMIAGAALAAGSITPVAAQTKASKIKNLDAAIEKAIQGDGMLVLPAGDIVTDTVMIDGGVTITGIAGRTRLVSRSGKAILRIATGEPVTISGVSFGGQESASEAMVLAENSSQLTVTGCRFADTSDTALQLEGSGGRISGNRFIKIGRSAIFSRDAKGLVISENTITDIGNNAIQVWTSTPAEDGTIVSNNRIARVAYTDGGTGQNGNGVIVFRAGNVIVEGNRISDCAFTAVRNNSGANCHIVNNNISRMGEVAIYCEFAFDGAVVSGNIIEDTGLGISITNLDYNGRLATVANNVVRRCKGPGSLKETSGTGIHCEGDATVVGNVVEETRDSGISLGWGPHSRTLTATGNIVRDARIGIRFSMTKGADVVLIANNRISGARDMAIAGYDHSDPVTGDLSLPGAEIPAGVQIRDNLTG